MFKKIVKKLLKNCSFCYIFIVYFCYLFFDLYIF